MRLTVGKKLNTLIGALQLFSIVCVVILATSLFTEDLTGLLRKETLDTSSMLSGRVRAEMKHVADRARMLGAASLEDYKYEEDKLKFIQDNLSTDAQYIGLALYRRQSAEPAPSGMAAASGVASATGAVKAGAFAAIWRIAHPDAVKRFKLAQADFVALDRDFPLDLEAVGRGGVDFTVAKMKDGTPSLRMGIPLVQQKDGTFSQILVIELAQERLTGLFAEATGSTSYLVDRKGKVLASTDPSKFPAGDDLSSIPFISTLSSGKGQGGQSDFKDREGATQIGAYQKVGFADLSVISQVPLARAETAKKMLYRRTALMGGFFLSVAMVLGLLFSRTLTGPIQALAAAAKSVADGDFKVRLKTKEKGARDEIQEFSSTFNQMVSGLEERDKVKATFAKFHSKEMADKVLSGELHLGGDRKFATVFFSDVRGFTALSEGMDPEALVKILNRYMTRMVRVIIENGGIVDKYVGDAIMAVWGVPVGKEDDPYRAVMACLGMRKALAELNAEFIAEGIPPIKIGMGLNFGNLISGNIGSEERMEFTVIGDTVNTASRIESLTKEFGTDLLISREVLEKVEGRFVVEKAHEAKVKGKTEPLAVYKVHGYVDQDGKQVLIETPYSVYAAEHSDKVVHDKPKKKEGEGEAPAPAPAASIPIAVEPPVPDFAAYSADQAPCLLSAGIAAIETFVPESPKAVGETPARRESPSAPASATTALAPAPGGAPRRHARHHGPRRVRRLHLRALHVPVAAETEAAPVSLDRPPKGGGVSFASIIAWKSPVTLSLAKPVPSAPLPRFARDLELQESLAVHAIRAPYEGVAPDHALVPAEEAIPAALKYVADDQGILPPMQDADEIAEAAAAAVLAGAEVGVPAEAMSQAEEPAIPMTEIHLDDPEPVDEALAVAESQPTFDSQPQAPAVPEPQPDVAMPIVIEQVSEIFRSPARRVAEYSSGEIALPIGGLMEVDELDRAITDAVRGDHVSTISLDPPPENFEEAPIALEAPAVVEAPVAVEAPVVHEFESVHAPAAQADPFGGNTYNTLEPVTGESIVSEIHDAPKTAEKPLDPGPFQEALAAEVHDLMLYRKLEGELKAVHKEIADLKTLLAYYEEVLNKRAG